MSVIVSFSPARPNGRTYVVDRFVPEGRKRRTWAVVIREPDGSEGYHLCQCERYAIWMAGIMRQAEAKRQEQLDAFAAHPMGQIILSVPPETRDLLRQLFDLERRLRCPHFPA